MQYNIQNFNPEQPNRTGLFDSFIDARNRRDLNMLVQEKDRADEIAAEEAMAKAKAKTEAEAAEKKMIYDAFDMAHKDPTAENQMRVVGIMAQRNPEQAKAMRDGFASYNEETQKTIFRDSSNILTAFYTNPEVGIAKLEELANASDTAGEAGDAKKYREMIARAKTGQGGVDAVKDYFTFIISAIPGGDKAFEAMAKVGKEARERAAEPTLQAKRLEDLGFVKAQTNKTLAETKKYGLDADKLILEIEKMKKALPPGVELSDGAEKLVNSSVQEAAKSNALASQYTQLAKDFQNGVSNVGTAAKIAQEWEKMFGTEKAPTALRQEYLRLRNSEVLKMLPPGAASERDIELALASFPSETSSPDNITKFLNNMAKWKTYEGAIESAKAEWIQQNGTLGMAKASMKVGNREVQKGARFTEFIQDYVPNTSVLGAGGTAGTTFGTVPAGDAQPVVRVNLNN